MNKRWHAWIQLIDFAVEGRKRAAARDLHVGREKGKGEKTRRTKWNESDRQAGSLHVCSLSLSRDSVTRGKDPAAAESDQKTKVDFNSKGRKRKQRQRERERERR